ncbi:hypothetical protein P378_03210 [Desulforamulus profundi]|uniref:Uncharacterized protein n=1 Tax=Desulforamulus profundi TaxID=1383067 RepID=A0A2C6LLG0_9FIRM|nr:hypothetical protein [Desulforamulus profundi]PHJ39430.1 hypothetical protein P378_03210 [Desulforamulus profundi]
MFSEYIAWLKAFLPKAGVPLSELVVNLHVLMEVLKGTLPPVMAEVACSYVENGLKQLPQFSEELPSFIRMLKKNGLRMVATCVAGELHEIGIRMAADAYAKDAMEAITVANQLVNMGEKA